MGIVGETGHTSSMATAAMSGRKRAKQQHALVDVFTTYTTPIVPHLLDYSAVFDDYVMDRLELAKATLGLVHTYRTLQELLDELEQRYHVKVQQDVLCAQEELEALLSPTLYQLVPDATVLPPYTSSVISAEDLMMEAMLSRDDDDDENETNVDGFDDNDSGGRGKGTEGTSIGRNGIDEVNKAISRRARTLEGGSKHVNTAEAEDVLSDAILSREVASNCNNRNVTNGTSTVIAQQDILSADHDLAEESAALLEAMMNDRID
uniref:LOB domain-containing protein 10 n=1 Tax=Lygus hesperus TaxID=30085 RepID=A0A0A9WEV8_LYGHE